MEQYKFAIITPAYNASKTIGRCIDSLIKQTYPSWELIVVDDGSTDETFNIVNEYAQIDSRITLVTQQNAGPGMARNRGLDIIAEKDFDFVAFVDSDDYVDDNYLASVVDKIKETRCEIVVLDNYYETPDGIVLRKERLSDFAQLSKIEVIACQMTGKMPWGGCRKVFRKSLIDNNHIRYSVDAVGEEALFSFQCFYYAQVIEFLGKCVYHYVDQPYSQSKKGADDPWGQVALNMRDFLRCNGLYDQFELQSNSFLITALMVSLYRVALNHPYSEAIVVMKQKLREQRNVMRSKFDKKCMNTKTLFLYSLAKYSMLPLIIVMSKLRNH